MADATLWSVFTAGIISFVTPCVLPLVVPYLCFLAGVTLDDLGESTNAEIRRRVLANSAAFVLGFSAVFIALGATASAIGQSLRRLDMTVNLFGTQVGLFSVVAGVIIIAMGLHFLGVYRIAFLDREARFQVRQKPTGLLGSFVVGLAFGFGWTPCIGPILGTVLSVAGTEETVGRGAVLLAFYSLGIGVPFLIAAFFAGPFMRLMRRFRRYMGTVEKVMGGLLVATGILFIFGQMTAFSFWLLETFPALGTIG
ncbi:MAG: cytochrome c biogenesis protein CcdA [Bauldia sp.]|nr:cytochrome c biogenesis protein CcdA [Bauldia sp.]